MGNVFNSVQVRKPSKNTFDLSHDVKYSMEMGKLTPVFLQEVLPGDKFNIQTETLIRFSPLVAPVMHNIRVFTHYFFVPNRITWENWEAFISPDLVKDTPPEWPYINFLTPVAPGSVGDYFGLPTDVTGVGKVSALPFAAYNMIYNEYYRDQNLQPEIDYQLSNGRNFGSQHPIVQRRAWQHDYFTAALPFAQKGPSVNIPISGFDDVQVYRQAVIGAGDHVDIDGIIRESSSPVTATVIDRNAPASAGIAANELFAGTSELAAGSATINNLRVAMRLQEWFEKAARGGSRYVEQLMVHWSVKSSDARLNRPEFLGGTRNPVIISEVLQTSETQETPQATMAGHGLSAGSGKRITYYAEEHGYIIGIQSIMPSTAYQQGIPRHFSRETWENYAWPTFAHLGEQAILNKELYVDTDQEENEGTFGYIPRYSEYRYQPSRVAGDFRTTLKFWHLGRIFGTRPQLNINFIECAPRKDIFAVQDSTDHLWCHSYHKVFVRRSLPKYGTPTL